MYVLNQNVFLQVEENEWVVDYALKKRNVKLVPAGLDFGTEGFTRYCILRYDVSCRPAVPNVFCVTDNFSAARGV